MKIGLFYGSTTGACEKVAEILAEELINSGLETDIYNVANIKIDTIMNYDKIIMATSTWHSGDIQEDWEPLYDEMTRQNFKGKKVAFVGVGDQSGFPDFFAGSLGILSQPVRDNGGDIVGHWPTDGYMFNESSAVEGNYFIGLVLDQDNEADLTPGRIRQWVNQLKDEF